MNTEKHHQEAQDLSALLDGELPAQDARQAIRQLTGDPLLRARYAEYCAIGDLLRGHHDDLPGLTRRVMAALETEPTLLAPVRKPPERRTLLWLAAATCAAITWGLWSVTPHQGNAIPMAGLQTPTHPPADVMPYLAAHQDYAQAVLTVPEMQFRRVSLDGEKR